MKKIFYLLIATVAIFLFHYQAVALPIDSADFKMEIKNVKTVFDLNTFSNYNEKNNSTKLKIKTQRANIIGLDLGIGTLLYKETEYYYFPVTFKYVAPVFAVGIRYMHRFNPYISADFVKINFNCPFKIGDEIDFMNLQLMTGIRGNTPTFLKSMSGYTAVRMGYSLYFIDEIIHGIAFETEIGLHLTPTVFVAFSYNLNTAFLEDPLDDISNTLNVNTFALRIGFNF